MKPRVLYVLVQYPQLSETYIRTEIEAIKAVVDLKIVSFAEADYPYAGYVPYDLIASRAELQDVIDRFRPDVLHTHWLHTQLEDLVEVARDNAIPFTIRTHSFDTLYKTVPPMLAASIDALNSDLCLGLLALPFAVDTLERAGIAREKLHGVYPAIRYDDFLDRSPNGNGVINVGASLPKKSFEDFVALGASLPDLAFDLYPIGYSSEQLQHANATSGRPVTIHRPVEPAEMPAIYKAHRWLVVTASRDIGTVGWPLAIAEAQASGLGVCVPDLRSDLHEYVGPSGFFYDSLDEVRDIISQPYPREMREAGFAHARKSDIGAQKSVLTDLWEATVPTRR